MEADFVHNLIENTLSEFTTSNTTIIELGCGTGHNLVHLTTKFDAKFIAYEYADSHSINKRLFSRI